MKHIITPGLKILFLFILTDTSALPADWPKIIKAPSDVTITFYQPQVESFDKNILESRAAIMVKSPKQKDPVLGAVWIKATVLTDRDTRLIDLEEVEVTNAKFPNQDSTKVEELKQLLAKEIPTWDIDITIDHLVASLETTKAETKEKFKSDPPEIIHVEYPAVLITIDGDPIVAKLQETRYSYVVNTPFFIAVDSVTSTNYLKGGMIWYQSKKILEGWKWTDRVPEDLLNFVKRKSPDEPEVDADTIKTKPEIFVRTKPAELIVTDGEPEMASIKGTTLLYVNNSDTDILVDINTQMNYILISGRWFTAKSLDGPWSFVEPENLPADFAKIPKQSDMSNILINVPGTEESKDAILDTQVPQTAKVDRTKTIEVKYDGEPEFEDIEDTDLEYAVNTDKSVIKYENMYYCCDNAVWYEASTPLGPWKVSVSVPDEIYKMGPESPVYNTKYVYVYDTTPEVVYVGYYPGYTGCYVYGGTVIYGTGYYYPPWYGAYYYPRPVTYGFSMHYNPYMGWSVGFGMTFGGPYGFFSIGFSTGGYYGGYWGGGGYHAGYGHGYYHGRRAGFYAGYKYAENRGAGVSHFRDEGNRNVYRDQGAGVSTNDRQRPGNRDQSPGVSTNDRQRPGNRDQGTGVSTNDRQRQGGNNVSTMDKQRDKSGAKNDLYTDKQGNVYKRDGNEWKTKEGNKWSDANKSKDNSSFERNKQDLDKQRSSREKGNQRSQSYNQQRSSPQRSYNRGGGGGRGGGRR